MPKSSGRKLNLRRLYELIFLIFFGQCFYFLDCFYSKKIRNFTQIFFINHLIVNQLRSIFRNDFNL